MKPKVKLIVAGLLTALAASASFADCNPPCKGNKVCRYDSTHNPQFFCRKPPAAAVAAKQSPQPAEAVASKTGKARPYIGGGEDGQSIRRKQPGMTSSPTPKNSASAQFNPKELGVDKGK